MILLSIIPNQASFETALIQTIISVLMVISVWGVMKKPYKLSIGGVVFSLFLCLLLYLFPMSGSDYFAYKEIVETAGHTDMDSITQYTFHMEKPYWAIINFVHNDYLLFRLVVWGGSLILFYLTSKQLDLDRSIYIFYISIFLVQMTYVSRVCLAIAMSTYGLSFLLSIRNRSKLWARIIGLSLIILATYFHRSAIFLLFVYPLSFIRFNKIIMMGLLLIFPFIVVLVNTNLFDFILLSEFSDDSMIDATTVSYYINYHERKFGIGQVIYLALQYSTIVIICSILIKAIRNGDYKEWPKNVQFFANMTLLTVFISSIFLFTLNGSTDKLFERFIAFSYFPECVCLTHFFKINYKHKTIKLINYLIVGCVLYGSLYFSLYLVN